MKKKIILIVDDEPLNINLVANLLYDKYQVKVANNGADALDMIAKKKPDLILLDVVMPMMNGYEVALKLKENEDTKDISFIFLTAKNDLDSIVEGFEHGAVDYISKPFAKDELLARVNTHLKIDDLQKTLSSTVDKLNENIEELDRAKKEFEIIFNKSHNGIALTDLETNFILTNDSYSRITSYSKEELLSKNCHAMTIDEEKESSREMITTVLRNGSIDNIEKRCIVKDKTIYVNTSISLMPDKKRLLYNIIDITKLKKAEIKIAYYIKLIDKNIVTSSTDLNGYITEVSQAFCNISGYSKEELIGQKHNIIKHSDMPDEIYTNLWETIINNDIWNGEMKNKKKDGSFYWVDVTVFPELDEETGEKIGYISIRHEITDKKYIEELSIHDELTGLYNRRYFNATILQEINRSKRDNSNLYFMMLDVDNFKLYNDIYGHQEGDTVLEQIGLLLNSWTKRANDFSFRLGGEEFGIIIYENSNEEALSYANHIKKAVENLKITHNQNTAGDFITISIGLVSLNSLKNKNANKLYKEADNLLYQAKASGRNRVCFGSCLSDESFK
ncbi:MAG: diguanylate cyclase [Sulfurovum sp.]